MTDALALASLFFLASFAPKKSAIIFASIQPPITWEVTLETRYYAKCLYEMVRFDMLRTRGRWEHWTRERWVDEITLRLDHEHIATLEHAQRSEELMEGFGKYLLWSEQEVEDGKLAAGIHDVGKLFIPSMILEKPSALTAEETVIMRQHLNWSAWLVKRLPGFERVLPIVADHHEAYNGSGYPKGSRAHEISEITHALAIIDAYDAITNARYYKEAKTQRWAFWELRHCAGTQFDAELVELFIQFMGNGQTGGNIRDDKEPPPFQSPPGSRLIRRSA